MIDPKHLRLQELFRDRLFYIPEYQRAYSWKTKEREDLFSDLLKLQKKGRDAEHFMSTIVCLLRAELIKIGTDRFQKVEIVDGQQRLTTLIILLKAISKKINDKETQKALEKSLIPDGNTTILLQTNHDNSHYFSGYIRNGHAPDVDNGKTFADRELLNAIKESEDFILKWQGSGVPILDLLYLIKNQIYFLFHQIPETAEGTVYNVFEVLNSRGLEVSYLDQLKNTLMGLAFDLKDSNKEQIIGELKNTWRDIYNHVGLRSRMSNEILRFAATLRSPEAPGRPLSEQASVDELRKQATDARGITKIAEWLLRITQSYDSVFQDSRKEAVTKISQARLLAVAINMRDDLGDRQLLFDRWEKVTFRIYGLLSKDARIKVGDYTRLAWAVVNEKLSLESIKNKIDKIGSSFSVEDAVKNLKNTDCYSDWQEELRYFFFRYEEYLSARDGQNFKSEEWEKIWLKSPAKSIDHIWPQNTAPEDIVHSLGNLVLLPPNLNSKLQDQEAKKKMEAYKKVGLLITREVVGLIEEEEWSKQQVKKREASLLEWARKEWA